MDFESAGASGVRTRGKKKDIKKEEEDIFDPIDEFVEEDEEESSKMLP